MRGLPKLVDVERIAGGRKLILEEEGRTRELQYGTGGCFIGGLTQIHIGRFEYDDDEALQHELFVTLKNEQEEHIALRVYFDDPEFIRARLDATRHNVIDRSKQPQLLAILYDADSFTVRYELDGVEVQDLTIGIFLGPHYQLLEYASDVQSKRTEALPVISFKVESTKGETLELRLSVDPAEIREVYANLSAFVRSFDFPKAKAAVFSYAYLQAA